MSTTGGEPRASALEIAHYIKELQRQLADMAETADMPALAALCRAAVLEAARAELRATPAPRDQLARGEDAA